MDTTGANLSEIQKKLVLKKGLSAPLKKGTTVGKLVYTLQEETIGTVPVRTTEKIDKITYGYVLKKVLKSFWL